MTDGSGTGSGLSGGPRAFLAVRLLACFLPVAGSRAADERLFEWIRKEKFRGTLGLAGVDQLRQAKRCGLNAVGDDRAFFDLNRVKRRSLEAKKLGLRYYYAQTNFCRWREIPLAQRPYWLTEFRKMVDKAGAPLARTPDVFSETYWRGHVLPWALKIAALRNAGYPIEGFLIDFEMYDADYTIYFDRCFCRECAEYFVEHEKLEIDLDALDPPRFADWLRTTDRIRRYYLVLNQKILRIVTDIRKEVHAVCPGLQFGFYPHQDTWFFDALIDGFGTADVPVLVMTEYTYVYGKQNADFKFAEYFEKLSRRDNVFLVCGLWFRTQPSARMAANAYNLARQTDGCWFYPFETLVQDRDKAIEHVRNGRDAPAAEYLRAMATFSQELDKVLADGTYESPLAFESAKLPRNLKLPAGRAFQVERAIVVDGRLDDDGWKACQQLPRPFLTTPDISYTDPDRHGTTTARYATRVRVAHDDENLYLGVALDDPQADRLVARHDAKVRDETGVYDDDSFELFLDVNADRDDYHQFMVNCVGSVLDGYSKPGATLFGYSVDTSWDARGGAFATQRTGDGWTLEARIPFAALGVTTPADGDTWLVNFCRNKRSGGKADGEQSFWSGPPGYHDRECFAPLTFRRRR